MFSERYRDEQHKEAAVNELRALVKKWASEGFNWFDIRAGLLQFGGQGDDGMDEEVNAFFPELHNAPDDDLPDGVS